MTEITEGYDEDRVLLIIPEPFETSAQYSAFIEESVPFYRAVVLLPTPAFRWHWYYVDTTQISGVCAHFRDLEVDICAFGTGCVVSTQIDLAAIPNLNVI